MQRYRCALGTPVREYEVRAAVTPRRTSLTIACEVVSPAPGPLKRSLLSVIRTVQRTVERSNLSF